MNAMENVALLILAGICGLNELNLLEKLYQCSFV